MSTTIEGVDESAARRQAAIAPVLSSKLALPATAAPIVRRTGLTNRLGIVDGPAVVSIFAPAGYGKTTLLREWADQLPSVAYVALDGRDNDPVALVASIATALDRVEPFPRTVLKLLASPGVSLESTLLPALVEAIWGRKTTTVLMLDDAEHLHEQAALDVIASLMLRLPPTLRLAIAARRRLLAAVRAARRRGSPGRARCPGSGDR